MQNTDDYISIMIDSLCKKKELLEKIINKNNAQADCLAGKKYDEIDWESFDLLISEKEIMIERINEMDEGFQSLYDHIKEQLQENKNIYADGIRQMQDLIKQVTELSVSIRTGEERNRATIDKVMSGQKKIIRQTRNGLKVANSYQQTMQSNLYDDGISALNTQK